MPSACDLSPMTFSPRPFPDLRPIGGLESYHGEDRGQYTEGCTTTQTHSPLPTTNKHPFTLMEAPTHHNSDIKEASSSQDSRPLALRRGKSPPHLDLSIDINPYNQAKKPVVTATEISWNDSPYGGVNKAYDIIQQIGHDSEGPCHLLVHRNSKELRVVKTVRRPIISNEKPIEARILQDVCLEVHENIIEMFGFEYFEEIATVHYYFEYCSGGDLHALCERYMNHDTYFPEAFIWKVFVQLNDVLEYLHRGFDQKACDRPGIVHRDVKSSNVFLRRHSSNTMEYPDVVLADFGNATFDFATYDPAGTYAWQGPEIPRKSPKGDVWSMGAVIHQMIHLDLPIERLPSGIENTPENLDAWESRKDIRKPITTIPKPYSPKLIDMMLLALELDVNKRATSRRMTRTLKAAFLERFGANTHPALICKVEPLEDWAFDEACNRTPIGLDSEHYERADGGNQYFEMMEKLWNADSNEDALSET